MNDTSEMLLTGTLERFSRSRAYAPPRDDFGHLFAALLAMQPGGLAPERRMDAQPARQSR